MTDDRKTAESAAVTELRVQVGILGERVFGIDKNLGSRIEALSQKCRTTSKFFRPNNDFEKQQSF